MTGLVGQSIGKYQILEQIGTGGMAIVYKAYDTRLEREVAIKIIRRGAFPPDHLERILKRFEREAKALAKLSHPNIVKILEYGEHEGMPYLVMEYLPGGTLKQRLNTTLPWEQAIQLLILVAQALDYAHDHHVIHRDIKPSNILMTEKGQPMLTDFGIAKMLETEETATLTGTGVGLGTPEYMAPEQGRGQTDARSDIYSLGIVLYELVTGRKPFVADTPLAVVLMHSSEPLPPPRRFTPKLPVEVERVIIKALSKKPENRYQTMAGLARALKNLLQGRDKERRRQEEKLRSRGSHKQSLLESKAGDRFEKRITTNAVLIGMAGLVAVVFGVWFIFSGTRKASLPSSESSGSPSGTPISVVTSKAVTDANTATQDISMGSSQVDSTATSAAVSNPLQEIVDAQGISMVLIPAGEFAMGSNDGDPDEKPVHQVYLDSYYMDRYEVTNTSYRGCVDAGYCTPPQRTSSLTHDDYFFNHEFDDYPVIYADWGQARDYCAWRGTYLPTEAQWEKAARGTDGRTYPWGEELSCVHSNYSIPGICTEDTTPVGSYESGASPYGVYDMAGNPYEWVADWYSDTYYQYSPTSNPQGPVSGEHRVVRGGHNDARTSARFRVVPEFTTFYVIGFRCAQDASEQGAP